jgi:serine/threonine-protein kinase
MDQDMGYAEWSDQRLLSSPTGNKPRWASNTMIGSRLGKWVIDKELGRGGMGRVYLAHEEADGGKAAAVKVLAPDLAQESGFLQRFRREIDVLAQLDHPHIVQLLDSGAQDGTLFYAMEYIEGESFEELLHQHGRLPWREVLDAALQICPALKHAHDRGIIHRDLKPPNLIKTAKGVVKLTDFGIAKVFAGRHLTNTGGVVGTAEYLSPEQAAGKSASKRSDLYSLGVVVYTLLTGRTPFEGQTVADILHKHLYAQFERPRKLVPEIPYEVDDIVCQLLEKDPARRPADALVLQKQLERLSRKLERKAEPTVVNRSDARTVASNRTDGADDNPPGPATVMSRLVREELERENRGSVLTQWLNRPWVLLALLVLCVGLIVWRVWPSPVPTPEALFESASELMRSEDPADWDRAWTEYLEPLQRRYPDHPYQEQIKQCRQKIDDYSALRRALATVGSSVPKSEAQRFYQRGLRRCQEGNAPAARLIWQNVVTAFEGIESEERWVHLAAAGLAELDRRASPAAGHPDASVDQALERARQADAPAAEKVRRALEALYQDDGSAKEIRDRIQRAMPR